MTLAISNQLDMIRGCADQARMCVEWARTVQVTIRTYRFSGGQPGRGEKMLANELVLPKRFPVKDLSRKEISSSGGVFTFGDVVVSDISPPYTSHGGGGFSPEQLDPRQTVQQPAKDVEVEYSLDGDISGIYSLVSLNTGDPTAWSMVLRRTRKTP